ncbi:1,4-dihydroxy-2-naphthoate prenyltransferase [Orbus hercynius]|uniref:1,4-dihydroxy-2-naphthoate octaprenyltransferase n=1 Tax=Orbus hercynius TaxID=593135 RepID=A0A495RLA4_9GAMM|nr:1,4-dihydroxy-2-naphthoate polyprenyltransferase [Orbus hercynius]RKS87578.1 1,4-dihydroxy-2-naphthoate prenyltransferase [Orbus hercynius]
MKLVPWIESLRLKTLPLALSTILVGNALAYWHGHCNLWIMLLTLLTASLLQILSNLANDYGDAIKGADKHDRLGPLRGIQQGLITLKQLRQAIIINIILCLISGFALLSLACDSYIEFGQFILLGCCSIIAAITYTIGKKPYGYIGLGDLSVLIFFGLVSILGSYYLQNKQIDWLLFYPAIGCGLLSVAVLNINNLRDVHSDQLNNKRTLIVLIGDKAGCYYHALLLILAFCLLAHFSFSYLQTIWSYLFVIVAPLAAMQIHAVFKYRSTSAIAPLLFSTVKLAMLTNVLYCLGIVLS